MVHISACFSFPYFARTDPGSLEALSMCVALAASQMLRSSSFFFFLSRFLLHVCLCMTFHFPLSLSNGLTLIVMRKITPLCSRRRRGANYSHMQSKLFNRVSLLCFCSSILEMHTDLSSRGTAPVIIGFRILQRLCVVWQKSRFHHSNDLLVVSETMKKMQTSWFAFTCMWKPGTGDKQHVTTLVLFFVLVFYCRIWIEVAVSDIANPVLRKV